MTLYSSRHRFSKFSLRVGAAFSKLPLSPNHWTIITLIPALAAFWMLVKEQFLAAAILLIIAGFMDVIDGAVARWTDRASPLGAYLDTIFDRYVEGIIAFGLLFASLPSFWVPAYAWIFLYFFGGFMTTYAKAAAKEKGIVDEELAGGILERAERLIILFAGIILGAVSAVLLTYVIAALAILSNISALQRIWIARKQA